MSARRDRVRLRSHAAVLLLLVLLVLTAIPLGPTRIANRIAAPSEAGPLSGASHVARGPAVRPAAWPTTHGSSRGPGAPHPTTLPTGEFWETNSSFANQSYADAGCAASAVPGYFNATCNDQATSPTILNLANGKIGVAFTIYTNQSRTTCLGSASAVTERIGFVTSSDGGRSFGPIEYLGNDSSCEYLDAIEPSFAVGAGGVIYGVYVEENYSGNQGQYYPRSASVCCGYSDDAIAFTVSRDNGTTFSEPQTLVAGENLSRPSLAVHGRSAYVLYENFSNGTTTIPVGFAGFVFETPINENYLWSGDGGSTWSTPVILPGENASMYDDALGGAIAVSSTGRVAAAYFTNHSCPAGALIGWCWQSTDDLVYTSSTNNGTTWSALTTVAPDVGETQVYSGSYLAGYFQFAPSAALTFDATGTDAFVAYDGAYNNSAVSGTPFVFYASWLTSGLFVAVGPATGASFNVTPIAAPFSEGYEDSSWNPSIAVHGGTVYLAWTTSNESYCTTAVCPFNDGTYSEWVETSPNGGSSWGSPSFVDRAQSCSFGVCSIGNAGGSFAAFTSSLAFDGNTPLVAYALPYASTSTSEYWGGTWYSNVSYPTVLSVAQPWYGPTVTLNFTERNLTAGTIWGASVDGQPFWTNASSTTVGGVPESWPVAIAGLSPAGAWGVEEVPALSVPAEDAFAANATIDVNYSLYYLLTLGLEPDNPISASIWFYDHQGNYDWYDLYSELLPPQTFLWTNFADGPYFPAGSTLELNSSAEWVGGYNGLSYWTGNGSGSYTGLGSSANITFDSPINETGWQGGFGSYNLTVEPTGLPAGSTLHFELDGAAYSGPSTGPTNVSGVTTGAHVLTDAWAPSATRGWEYFGRPATGNPIVVPAEPVVNLTFAFVNLTASPGPVSFRAQGLTAGTGWSFEFNGTVYHSTTPWINVTTRPGDFPVQAFPIVSQNASVGYAPTPTTSPWTVTPGSTYPVAYGPAYKVEVVAGSGGLVGPKSGSFWVAPGTAASYNATPDPGFAFGGWTGTGAGSYTGSSGTANVTADGPILETAAFVPLPTGRFNLTFTETGLAAGTWWTVFLGTLGYSSDQSEFQVGDLLPCSASGGAGDYRLSVPYAYASDGLSRFVPTSPLPPEVCTNGTTTENEVFVPEYLLILQSTVGGFAEAQAGTTATTARAWVAAGASIALSAVAETGYGFLGWNGTGPGSFSGADATVSLIIEGPTTEIATFGPPPVPTYSLTFQLRSPLDAGTTWGIDLNGVGYTSTGSTLTVGDLSAENYSLSVSAVLSPDGLTQYAPTGTAATVSVPRATPVPVSFLTSFWVEVAGGPGGSTSPGPGWFDSGAAILLNATAQPGYEFVGWNGTGAGSYTGADPGAQAESRAPITEVATFAPTSPPATSHGTPSSASPVLGIALGGIGLVAAVGAGLWVGRRSRRPPPTAADPESPTAPARDDEDLAPPPPGGP